MPHFRSLLLLLGAALFAACDSKVTSTTDQTRLDQVQTVVDCFPGLYTKVDALLDVADSWRLRTSSAVPDPAGLSVSQGGGGELNVTYAFNGCTMSMTIRAYDPAGAEQSIDASSASSLADKIDLIATALRNASPGGRPFLVGDWTLTGSKGGDAVSGSGTLTGIIGGSTNGNELEELRTTTATPAGGPPPAADSSVTEGACVLTFGTASLVTDASPTQQYPIGTIDLSLTGPLATVAATMTFDGSSIVRITIDGLPGRFDFDVDARTLTVVP